MNGGFSTDNRQAVGYDGQAVGYDGQAMGYDGQAMGCDGQAVGYDVDLTPTNCVIVSAARQSRRRSNGGSPTCVQPHRDSRSS